MLYVNQQPDKSRPLRIHQSFAKKNLSSVSLRRCCRLESHGFDFPYLATRYAKWERSDVPCGIPCSRPLIYRAAPVNNYIFASRDRVASFAFSASWGTLRWSRSRLGSASLIADCGRCSSLFVCPKKARKVLFSCTRQHAKLAT